jgi:predicted RNA-binding protein with PUA-like domain
MNYWLMKTEPGTFSWSDLEKAKTTTWDGVRNFQARSNLKSMKKGDITFIYHSNEDKAIIGTAKVLTDGYPDPKAADWVVVDIAPWKKLKRPVTLAEVKASRKLGNMVLARNSRLSVQPVSKEEFDDILALSESK